MNKHPEGALRNRRELKAWIKNTEKPTPFWMVWPKAYSPNHKEDGILRKRWLAPDSSISESETIMFYRNYDNITKKSCNIVALFPGRGGARKRAYIFTNYWLAYAHALRVKGANKKNI
jgi:hypothetical protein